MKSSSPDNTIPFLSLKRQHEDIKDEINSSVQRVLERQEFILGSELNEFELSFAHYLGSSFVVGVNSGTDGLRIALRAIGVGAGDEVITTTHTFIATALAIIDVGATPVFVDVGPHTYQMDVTAVEKKITEKTKAILPVHIYGAPSPMEEIISLAHSCNLRLVEDACQAHGAVLNGKKLGTFGDIGVFSFYPSKNLGAYGDGGAICTSDADLYEKIKRLRNYGQPKKYYHEEFGYNSRLDEIQAAVLKVKLSHLDEWNLMRQRLASIYDSKLTDFHPQKIIPGGKSVYHIYSILSNRRDELMAFLSEKKIMTQIHYPVPLHLQKALSSLGYKEGDFPVSEMLAKKEISLPMFSELTQEELSIICDTVLDFGK
ncbi:MAG: DegT/DnrJ/EryC1/StrS aminotransferase [candidate division WWE3 bacterium GW2011_GWF2_41_45]|nr:MAG: DegT/DnrJ/EryC1/StrS aminotransferase [candidate division WWE3 bacterium GW2011_GWF2_41_45]KKS12479.1 MAG: DegT/DnrJ/EryC1/StrS aminotransferase [candidate division WWE3 bacterium GW2011_GWF1_41_53]KKS20142.1 MAG: DegT/DnrJ/EryC1/StrS aminotransferase [candidate division WWE3 bacterium GW2011_GWE1_41_72]KKS29809.1 MAG: DegT/DnrJ/EryC1/StrS aminotransferase [candidate division WWE3 bacterium GW2011_GWD2_42_11]KKS61103.1 MAG: DegT/DnrJ/EryC1/StrS aminotransferase [candidate division WWE3 